MVCFMYIIVNTLHTGDNKDDGDNNNNNNMYLLTSGSTAQIPIKNPTQNTKHTNDVNTHNNNIVSNNVIMNSLGNTGL